MRTSRQKKREVTCPTCHKNFSPLPSQIIGGNFCSYTCAHVHFERVKHDKAIAFVLKRTEKRSEVMGYAKPNLTVDYLRELYYKQGQRCAYTKIPIRLVGQRQYRNTYPSDQMTTASLDRIDSDRDYVRGNVQWVSLSINYMKHTMSDADTKALIQMIKNN